MTVDDTLMLQVSRQAAAHLQVAIREHRAVLHQLGQPVDPELVQLERRCVEAAQSGPTHSPSRVRLAGDFAPARGPVFRQLTDDGWVTSHDWDARPTHVSVATPTADEGDAGLRQSVTDALATPDDDSVDVAAVAALDPPARTVADVATRLRWRKGRAAAALRQHRADAAPPAAGDEADRAARPTHSTAARR